MTEEIKQFRFCLRTVEKYNRILSFLKDGGNAKEVASNFDYPLKSAEQCLRKLVEAGYLNIHKVRANGRSHAVYTTIRDEILEEHIRIYENERTLGRVYKPTSEYATFYPERMVSSAKPKTIQNYYGNSFNIV